MTKQTRMTAVGSVLRAALARIDPEKRLEAFEVWKVWDEIAGETLARRAQPSGYRNGVLFITVANHAWMQELQFMKDALRERLNERLGNQAIREIELVSGNIEEFLPKEPLPAEPEHEAAAAPIALPDIGDANLAAVFRRITEAHARRKRRG